MKVDPIRRVTEREILALPKGYASLEAPVIIAGGAAMWPAMVTMQLRELKKRFGALRIPVRPTDDEFEVFFGGKALNFGRRHMMTLAEYVDALECLDPSAPRPPYAGNISILNDPAAARQLHVLTQECHFPDLALESHSKDYRLWIGARGQRSTIHNDAYHNLNAQIVGQKRVFAFSPEQHRLLYPAFMTRATWASPVDPAAPDLTRYPDFDQVCALQGELGPGDVLFLPRFWWHSLEALSVCVNINQWLYTIAGDRYWHEQPQARHLINHQDLLATQRRKYEALSSDLQAYYAEDFESLKSDLQRFVNLAP